MDTTLKPHPDLIQDLVDANRIFFHQRIQGLALGNVEALTAGEAEATRITNEGQVERPWNLWKQQAYGAAE